MKALAALLRRAGAWLAAVAAALESPAVEPLPDASPRAEARIAEARDRLLGRYY